MAKHRPKVLIAAPSEVIQRLASFLLPEVQVIGATSLDEAMRVLRLRPGVIVVCYAFDELRPYRLIKDVRAAYQGRLAAIVLVRALPIALGASGEGEVRKTYRAMGVAEFVNFIDVQKRHGAAAAGAAFREAVLGKLRDGRHGATPLRA